jgi:pimeloyl-[acyl-carrier protein] methyl ester esterase
VNPGCAVTGSGPDVVLIHGWGVDAGVWHGLAGTLAARYRVHMPDLPGYGRSPPCAPYCLKALADAIARGAPRSCHVVGWSLGSLVAMAWARARPQQIVRMVLLAATPCFTRRDSWAYGVNAQVLQAFARDLLASRAGAIRRFVALQSLGDAHARQVASELRRHLPASDATSIAALHGGLDILLDADLRNDLAWIPHETLVVHGDCDRLVPPAAGRYLGHAIRGARFEAMPGAAHAPFLSQLPGVSGLLMDFLHG